LREFFALIDKDPSDDEAILKELDAVSRDTPDEQLSVVERFAVKEDAKPFAWPLVRILVERNRLDTAAEVIVSALLPFPGKRQYRMWKWWEYNFGKRADFFELSHAIAESMSVQFAKGPEDRKEVIAELFELGPAGATLSVDEFRQRLSLDKKRE